MGNTINVQGSYIDIHDNEVVNLTVDKARVRLGDSGEHQAEEESAVIDGQDDTDLTEVLKPIFFNNEEDVRLFLKEISGMRPNTITDLVNQWVQDKRISDYGNSRKGDLWKILNEAGLYTKSRQNWNRRVY